MAHLQLRRKAIGGDSVSAASRGIRVHLVKTLAFMTCSMLAGFSAIITLCREPRTHVTIGQDLELQAIAASVIGGVLLTGGRGSIIGAALGTFFFAIALLQSLDEMSRR